MADRDGFKVKIGDRRYVVDLTKSSWIPTTAYRESIDDGAEPGEQSLNQHGIWRKTRRNFILGAGQEFADELEESDVLRFYDSRGINPFEERSFRLASTIQDQPSSPGGIVRLEGTREHLYAFNDNATSVSYITAAGQTFSSTFNLHAAFALLNVPETTATDGTKVWYVAANGNLGQIDGTTATAFSTAVSFTMVGYANGRLLAGSNGNLYEVSSVGVTTLIFDHPDPQWMWLGVVGAPNGIYAWGYNGGAGSTFLESAHGEIYFIGISDVDTALDIPIVATSLPQGEVVWRLLHFGGLMVIGTGVGLRLATIDGPGYLQYGPLIEQIPGNFGENFLLQGHVVWVPCREGSRSGMMQVRLDRFTEPLVPRYVRFCDHASGNRIRHARLFDGRIYVVVNDDSIGFVNLETDTFATSDNFLRTGWITYGVSERKAFRQLEIITDPLAAGTTVRGLLVQPDGTVTTAVTMTTTGQEVGSGTTGIEDEMVDIRVEIVPPNTTTQVVVRRVTLRSIPLPYRASDVTLSLLIDSAVEEESGHQVRMQPLSEWEYLRTLEANRSVINFEFGGYSTTAYVDGVGFEEGALQAWVEGERFPSGRVVVTLVTADLG